MLEYFERISILTDQIGHNRPKITGEMRGRKKEDRNKANHPIKILIKVFDDFKFPCDNNN
jgi:hypothetical protein